jgi:alanine dehydrogenase
LTPPGVRELVEAGAKVYVEAGAGDSAGFANQEYREAGATLTYEKDEVYRRAELVVSVERPDESLWKILQPGAVLMAFLHLAAAPKPVLRELVKQDVTAIGLEVIQRDDGVLPILQIMSEIAGRLAPQIAGRLLETPRGLGVLLSGIPGTPPADVVIVGAGTLGQSAVRAFLGAGACVHVLDRSRDQLEAIDRILQGRAVTALATRHNLEKFSAFADVLVGAAHVPGQRAPLLLTRDMVHRMRRSAILLDFAIDQGGIAETSTLTPREELVFVAEGVIHYCAPNVPALVARTASHALTQALVPFLHDIVARGSEAVEEIASLRRGICVRKGTIVHPALAGLATS